MRVHTGDKAYACDQCSFTTNVRGSLSMHVRVHSAESRKKNKKRPPPSLSLAQSSSLSSSSPPRHASSLATQPFADDVLVASATARTIAQLSPSSQTSCPGWG
jgi:hypothetical protein